jgi:hypothetical protein
VLKCASDADYFYTVLVMVSNGARKRTLAGKRVPQNGSIDTNFDPPEFPLDSTFNIQIRYLPDV